MVRVEAEGSWKRYYRMRQEPVVRSTMRSKPKSYSLKVVMFVMLAIAFTDCPRRRSRPAMVKPQPSESAMGNYSRAAVAVDGEPCAQVGM